jgi:hypothetical protein
MELIMYESTKILVEDLKKEKQNPRMLRIIDKAEKDYYHDFFGDCDLPELELINELRFAGASKEIIENVANNKYSATKEESEAWMRSPEGQQVFNELLNPLKRKKC